MLNFYLFYSADVVLFPRLACFVTLRVMVKNQKHNEYRYRKGGNIFDKFNCIGDF